METSKKNKTKEPIDIIIDAFVDSLELASAKQYRQVKNAFKITDAFLRCSDNAKSFLEKLPQLIKNRNFDEIKQLVDEIKNKALNSEHYDWNANKQKSYKTYLKRFLNFIESVNTDITQAVEFVKDSDTLFSIFRRRLGSQDRVSGDKIWLPLKYISSIYNQGNNKGFSEWLNKLTKRIYIHYLDNGIIRSCKFEEIDSMIFRHDNDNPNKYQVFLKKEGKEYGVLTPTGKGNKKELMIVKSIRDIAIDHVKPIDITLRELEEKEKLKLLEKVSESYKALKENKELKKSDSIGNLLTDTNFCNNLLNNELKQIGNDSPLRLMAAEYNSQKSNGKSFEKYINIGDTKWGVLEEKVYERDAINPTMILCQKLDNNMSENGKNRILHNVNLVKCDITNGFNLEENIDCV